MQPGRVTAATVAEATARQQVDRCAGEVALRWSTLTPAQVLEFANRAERHVRTLGLLLEQAAQELHRLHKECAGLERAVRDMRIAAFSGPLRLTRREAKGVHLVAVAFDNSGIAVALGIGRETVKGHLHVAFGKLGRLTSGSSPSPSPASPEWGVLAPPSRISP